jgi:hypothetical protein
MVMLRKIAKTMMALKVEITSNNPISIPPNSSWGLASMNELSLTWDHEERWTPYSDKVITTMAF